MQGNVSRSQKNLSIFKIGSAVTLEQSKIANRMNNRFRIAVKQEAQGVNLRLPMYFCCSVRFNVPSLSQFKHFPRNHSSKICRHLCQMRHTLVRKASILLNLAEHQPCSRKSSSTILDAFRLALLPWPSCSCDRHTDP